VKVNVVTDKGLIGVELEEGKVYQLAHSPEKRNPIILGKDIITNARIRPMIVSRITELRKSIIVKFEIAEK
jgi:hypothetical protein